MRNASKYQMKLLAVLLCTAALSGCSLFSSKEA
jgi:peptidyl-prolyl cis-trans isomerase SurA